MTKSSKATPGLSVGGAVRTESTKEYYQPITKLKEDQQLFNRFGAFTCIY